MVGADAMAAGTAGDDAAMPTIALAGLRAGKSMRAIAVELYGADQVAADWHGDSRMRARVRYRLDKAREIERTRQDGDRDIAAGGTNGRLTRQAATACAGRR